MRSLAPAILLSALIGCTAPPATSVSDRLTRDGAESRAMNQPASAAEPAPESGMSAPSAAPDTLALINGSAISSEQFYELLLNSHGLLVLEQMISLVLVESEAERLGIQLKQYDIQQEYDRSLMDLARTTTKDDDPKTLLVVGQQILDEFLRSKNISQAEYLAGMRRNAYLRKIIEPTIEIDDDELLAAFKRRFGRKAIARHIALGTMKEATAIRRQLIEGADFSNLAVDRSLNRLSAPGGGLLNPFTRDDPDLPAILRQMIFRMQPGEISDVVKLEGTFQIFKLERFEEPDTTSLADVNSRLKKELFEEKVRNRMQELERELFRSADIDIVNPTLRRLFSEKYGSQSR